MATTTLQPGLMAPTGSPAGQPLATTGNTITVPFPTPTTSAEGGRLNRGIN